MIILYKILLGSYDMKPFLKWAGNKFPIIDRINGILPAGDRLVEPFVGSGAVFLNTNYSSYLLCDSNADLINLYKQIQKEGPDFIKYVRTFFVPRNNIEERFYHFRNCFNTTNDIRKKSAIFIYLNKHCYNGLCRYNSKGGFNTPFGRYSSVYFPKDKLMFFWKKAKNIKKTKFMLADFRDTMNNSKKGDVIYCDPPYVPLSDTANFNSYGSNGFDIELQTSLARLAERNAKKGVPVVISNHGTEFIHNEYKNAQIDSFLVQRFISTNGNKRIKAPEVLALFNC